MKQFASWFTHGIPGGGALRKQIFEAKNGNAVLDAVEAFFATRAETSVHTNHANVIELDEAVHASACASCN